MTKQPKSLGSNSSFFGNAFGLLKQTGQEFLEDKAPQLGAALAYYTVFSLAPLILVLLAVVGSSSAMIRGEHGTKSHNK